MTRDRRISPNFTTNRRETPYAAKSARRGVDAPPAATHGPGLPWKRASLALRIGPGCSR